MSETLRTDERDTSLREVTGWDSPAYNHLLFFTNKLEKELAAERERADRNQEDAERISWLQLYATMAESDNPDEVDAADEIGDSLREIFIANGGDLRAAIDSVRRK